MSYSRTEEADEIIKNHSIYSMGMGLIPIPVIDFLSVVAVQLDMTQKLCSVYGVSYQESIGKSIISSLASTTLAQIGASLVKSIPFIGSIIGGVSSAILSGATTYAIGEVLKKHFEEGGSIHDLNVADFKDYYAEKLNRGQSLAKQWQQEEQKRNYERPQPTPERKQPNIPIDKLKELADLKAAGILTEEEFQQMKHKLINGEW